MPATILIALGAFFPTITDSLNRAGSTELFQLGKFLGVVFLFAGFLVSVEVFREIRVPFTSIRLSTSRRDRAARRDAEVQDAELPGSPGVTAVLPAEEAAGASGPLADARAGRDGAAAGPLSGPWPDGPRARRRHHPFPGVSRTAMLHRMDGASTRPAEAEAPAKIRVLLVDDHAVVRRGLKGFFELLDDIVIVGEAEDGAQAVQLVEEHQPDVVLMDLLMPVMDGIAATAEIKQRFPDVEVVALTSFIEEERVTAALEAGATGYLLKDADADDVAVAVRRAHAGEVHLDPQVARLLARRIRSRRDDEPAREPLTEREREVLSLVAKGHSNKEIAALLDITERTARTHVSNILGKLDLASRTQAALWAIEHKVS